jgi:Tol biopolymer transport system component
MGRHLNQSERRLSSLLSHPGSLGLIACVLIGCSGSPGAKTDMLRVVFVSPQKLDGTDALNSNESNNVHGTYNVWRVNADGTGLTPITNATATGASSGAAHWSPDGSKLIFNSARKLDGTDASNPAHNIWRVNADGTGLTPLTHVTAARADCTQPQWSPDGTKIVFASRRNLDGTDAPNTHFTFNIWWVSADGTGLTPLTHATADGTDSTQPQWSPDGTEIVFASRRNLDGRDAPNAHFTFNIWRVSADGTGLIPLTNLTSAHTGATAPRWSPDGSSVVFNSSRSLDGTDAPNTNFTSNIWRANADRTGLTPLTTATVRRADSAEPRWSPDGSKIVFYSFLNLDGSDAPNSNRTSNIWRMNADGTGLAPLTTATALGVVSSEPHWSPDGSEVVFRSTRKLDGTDAPSPNVNYNIWLMNADGTGLKPLTMATASEVNSESPSFSH